MRWRCAVCVWLLVRWSTPGWEREDGGGLLSVGDTECLISLKTSITNIGTGCLGYTEPVYSHVFHRLSLKQFFKWIKYLQSQYLQCWSPLFLTRVTALLDFSFRTASWLMVIHSCLLGAWSWIIKSLRPLFTLPYDMVLHHAGDRSEDRDDATTYCKILVCFYCFLGQNWCLYCFSSRGCCPNCPCNQILFALCWF